jgi:hypothetical protein
MSDNINFLIEKRLKNIEKRIIHLLYLQAHLRKFYEDWAKIKPHSNAFLAVYLFSSYSFSHLVLELNKLFYEEEYYSILKLLNYILSNIKNVKWYKSEVKFPKNAIISGRINYVKGKRYLTFEKVYGDELKTKNKLICNLEKRICESKIYINEIKNARDKILAHLDKNYSDYNFDINIEITGKLLSLAFEVFNILSYELTGKSHADVDNFSIISTLEPINKFLKIRKKIYAANRKKQKTINIEELNKIINR